MVNTINFRLGVGLRIILIVSFFLYTSCAPQYSPEDFLLRQPIPRDQRILEFFERSKKIDPNVDAAKAIGVAYVNEVEKVVAKYDKDIAQNKFYKQIATGVAGFIALAGGTLVAVNPGDTGKSIGAISAILGGAASLVTVFIFPTEKEEKCIPDVKALTRKYRSDVNKITDYIGIKELVSDLESDVKNAVLDCALLGDLNNIVPKVFPSAP